MKKPLVLLTHPLPDDWISLLKGKVDLIIGDPEIGIRSLNINGSLSAAEGIFCLLSDRVGAALLGKAAKLKTISIMAAGYDNVDVSACTSRGITVGNTPGILTNATADITFGLILSLTRNLPNAFADARNGLWKTWSPTGWLGVELAGKTLGIIGMGKIGKAVAKRAIGFDMKVIYQSRSEIQDDGLYRAVGLDELLQTSDIISLHCPLTVETNGMINKTTLGKMKKTAFLINTSRGKVIDQDALVYALVQNRIAGAALDVTDPEPLPPTHPLFYLDNCLILPHIGSATAEARKKMAEMACENLLAGLAGQSLPNLVNPEVYS